MELEIALKQVVSRPGARILSESELKAKLDAYSGFSAEASSLEDMPIIGMNLDKVTATEQNIGGRIVTVVYIPVLCWNEDEKEATWKVTSFGALTRSTQESVKELGKGFAQEAQYASDGEFIQLLHDHVGDGDPKAKKLPKQHIALKSVVLEREFDGRKSKQKFHHLTLVG